MCRTVMDVYNTDKEAQKVIFKTEIPSNQSRITSVFSLRFKCFSPDASTRMKASLYRNWEINEH